MLSKIGQIFWVEKSEQTAFLFILLIFTLSRFVKLSSFQYWSDDEEILWMMIRHIAVDKHPSLVVPNAAVGISLGPLYHYLITPWYLLSNFNPQQILLLGNFIGYFSLLAIYKTGKLLGGTWTGFIAAFLYASSFISSLFDRRLWALTPNVLLVTLSIYSLIKIFRGDSRYLILLTVCTLFAINSDPSLGIIGLTSILVFFLKPKIKKRHVLLSFLLGFLIMTPLIIFEIRHQGQNTRSLSYFLNLQKKEELKTDLSKTIILQLENFTRFIYVPPTKAADAYFCYCSLDDHRIKSVIFAVITILVTFVIYRRKREQLTLTLFLISYLAGIIFFTLIFKGLPAFFYSVVISPVVYLIIALILSTRVFITVTILILFFIFNFHTLLISGFKYPLGEKIALVQEIVPFLPDKFSLYYSGDIMVASGGWTGLFTYLGKIPVKGSLSLYWKHLYETYQLYPITFSETEQNQVVVISEKNIDQNSSTKAIFKRNNLQAIIYNNNGWFYPQASVEELYQPNYFKQ